MVTDPDYWLMNDIYSVLSKVKLFSEHFTILMQRVWRIKGMERARKEIYCNESVFILINPMQCKCRTNYRKQVKSCTCNGNIRTSIKAPRREATPSC